MWWRTSIAAAMLIISYPLAAQSQHWDVTPLFGYRSDISFNTDPVVDNVPSKITFNGGFAFGVAFGGRVNDEDVVEFRWSRQETRVRFSPAFASSSRVHLDQFHFDFSHEYEIKGWPEGRAFIMASIGATRVSGSDSFPGFTRLSFGMGGGIKAFPFSSPQVGFKAQVQWLPIVFNPQTTARCISDCVIRFGGKLGSQVEIAAGPVFRF